MDQLLRRPQSGFPYTLFRLLLPSCDVAAERQHIRNAPDCMLDEFSKRFLKVYPALDGDECFAVLTAVGLMQAHISYYNIVCVDRIRKFTHTSTRRWLHVPTGPLT